MNIVFDSNVIVAAFAAHGLCHSVFEYCLNRHDIWICEALLQEVSKALVQKIKLPPSKAKEVCDYIKNNSRLFEPPLLDLKNVCRDHHDFYLLSLADAQHCKYIVTGDQDLLVLKNFKKIHIVSPREFWQEIRK